MYSQKERDKFCELKANGNSLRSISKKMNISTSTLFTWNLEHQEQIRKIEYLIIQETMEKYKAIKQNNNKIQGVYYPNLWEKSSHIVPNKEIWYVKRCI